MKALISSRSQLVILAGVLFLTWVGKGNATQETRPEAEVVFVSVTATDGDGRPVLDLEPDDFVILENGIPILIERFEAPNIPVNVAIVVDSSPRTNLSVDWTRRELKNFLGVLGTANPATVIEAQTQVRLLLPLTTDREELGRAIDSVQSTGSPTNRIFDAASEALVTLLAAGTARNAVVVITDGIDVGSRRDQETFNYAVRIAGIPIYVITLDNVDGYSNIINANVAALRADNRLRAQVANLAEEMKRMYYDRRDFWRVLAEQSGGEFFDAENGDAFSEMYGELVNRISATYTFYYHSNGDPSASDWIPIDVRAKRPGILLRAPTGIQLLESGETN